MNLWNNQHSNHYNFEHYSVRTEKFRRSFIPFSVIDCQYILSSILYGDHQHCFFWHFLSHFITLYFVVYVSVLSQSSLLAAILIDVLFIHSLIVIVIRCVTCFGHKAVLVWGIVITQSLATLSSPWTQGWLSTSLAEDSTRNSRSNDSSRSSDNYSMKFLASRSATQQKLFSDLLLCCGPGGSCQSVCLSFMAQK